MTLRESGEGRCVAFEATCWLIGTKKDRAGIRYAGFHSAATGAGLPGSGPAVTSREFENQVSKQKAKPSPRYTQVFTRIRYKRRTNIVNLTVTRWNRDRTIIEIRGRFRGSGRTLPAPAGAFPTRRPNVSGHRGPGDEPTSVSIEPLTRNGDTRRNGFEEWWMCLQDTFHK